MRYFICQKDKSFTVTELKLPNPGEVGNGACMSIWTDQPTAHVCDTSRTADYSVTRFFAGASQSRENLWDIYGLMRMTQQHICTLCALLHTRVCERPCLRKMQAGPTMLCSMLQFFTRVSKGLLNSSSSTSWSSAASTALTFPSTTPFRGRQRYFHHSDTLTAQPSERNCILKARLRRAIL